MRPFPVATHVHPLHRLSALDPVQCSTWGIFFRLVRKHWNTHIMHVRYTNRCIDSPPKIRLSRLAMQLVLVVPAEDLGTVGNVPRPTLLQCFQELLTRMPRNLRVARCHCGKTWRSWHYPVAGPLFSHVIGNCCGVNHAPMTRRTTCGLPWYDWTESPGPSPRCEKLKTYRTYLWQVALVLAADESVWIPCLLLKSGPDQIAFRN